MAETPRTAFGAVAADRRNDLRVANDRRWLLDVSWALSLRVRPIALDIWLLGH